MTKITAVHTNGYVRLAMVRNDEDVSQVVATLESRGYWTSIKAEPFVLEPRRKVAR